MVHFVRWYFYIIGLKKYIICDQFHGPKCASFRCDVTKMEDVVSLYDEAENHFKDKVLFLDAVNKLKQN